MVFKNSVSATGKKNEQKTQIIRECFPFTPMYNLIVSETEPKGCVCVRLGVGEGGERRKGKRERFNRI